MPTPHEPLPPADLAHAVAALDGWEGDLHGITRTVETSSFPVAIELVRAVAGIAEAMDHHPDIDIRWRTVKFHLRTHSADGVTKLDIDQAKRIDALLAED